MKLAWLFPGQGTQTVGMGKALAESSAAARRVFERADAALGESLSKLCFEGPEADLTLTANTQPAILTTSIAVLEALKEAVPEGQGAMAAIIGGDEASVRALCDEARGTDVLAPANFNAPGQIVIAGHA